MAMIKSNPRQTRLRGILLMSTDACREFQFGESFGAHTLGESRALSSRSPRTKLNCSGWMAGQSLAVVRVGRARETGEWKLRTGGRGLFGIDHHSVFMCP